MFEASICPAVVAQNILKHLVQLAQVVVSGSRVYHRQESFTPLWRECRSFARKEHRIAPDITDMFAIRLFGCAIVGTVRQRLLSFWTTGHKA